MTESPLRAPAIDRINAQLGQATDWVYLVSSHVCLKCSSSALQTCVNTHGRRNQENSIPCIEWLNKIEKCTCRGLSWPRFRRRKQPLSLSLQQRHPINAHRLLPRIRGHRRCIRRLRLPRTVLKDFMQHLQLSLKTTPKSVLTYSPP